jgi:hypothetical protein
MSKKQDPGFRVMTDAEVDEIFGPFGPATDAREQLRRWDAGKAIWSIEMGGMGPGYEQAIQILAIEIVRDWIDKPLREPANSFDFADATVKRIDQKQPDGTFACGGFSGAQVVAAANLAYQWLKRGPAACHKDQAVKDRLIQVSKFWPKAPEPTA